MYIILRHENYCSLSPVLYSEIPKYIQLTPHEKSGSGKEPEAIWRGTLRGYLSRLYKNKEVDKHPVRGTKIYRVVKPEHWDYLLEHPENIPFWSTLRYG
jgi:hypothetical protein